MKKAIFILIIFITLLSNEIISQEGWVEQIPPTETPGLSGVYAIDSLNVWAVGRDGTIIHTSDGGMAWEILGQRM